MMNHEKSEQRTCGLLGGLSYVSTVDYYNSINRLISEFLIDHSSRIHMVSVDIFQYTRFLEESQWSQAADYLLEGVHRLVKSGIDFLVICSNTGHMVVPKIMEYYPQLVLLHISDAVAFAIKQKKFRKVGFLGTKMTMKLDSCAVKRLIQHDLDILFPDEEEIDKIHHIIATQLSINIFSKESKQIYLKVIQRMYDEHQVEGVILGCTEIPLLIQQNDIPRVPLFNSTKLHVQLAVEYQLNRCNINDFLPPNNSKN
ncbi:unnamed protein product [Adineta ricciae]|uniref:Aspartate racemase n=1 Tax=Adineta ricciae TaxID=249248 RepID=A0A814XIN9_ADIRI|nr:unnamed protein product [Adineta ricciae]CAF1525112.1 unnamed protein product [Adineta ricciae]